MEQNYLISHKDIADRGYYFLDTEQENQYLTSVNDEFALRVGNEITQRIPKEKRGCICTLSQEELLEFIKENVPDIEETVNKIKERLLKELKDKRKNILLNEMPH